MSVTHRQSIGYRRPLSAGWARGRRRLKHATGRETGRERQGLLAQFRTLDWTSRNPTSDRELLRVLLTVGVAALVASVLAANALAAWARTGEDLLPAVLSAAIVAAVLAAMAIPVRGELRRRRAGSQGRRSAD